MATIDPSFASETATPIVPRRVTGANNVQQPVAPYPHYVYYGQTHSTPTIPTSAQTSPAYFPSSPFTPIPDTNQATSSIGHLSSYSNYNALALTSVPMPLNPYGGLHPTPPFPTTADVLASNALQISSFHSQTTTTHTSPSGDEPFIFGPMEMTAGSQAMATGPWQMSAGASFSDGEPQPGTVHGHGIDRNVGPSSSSKADLKKRTRSVQACERCRRRKARCFGGEPCDRCVKRNFVCEFATNVRQRGPNRSRPDLKPHKMSSTSSGRKVTKARRHSMPHSHSVGIAPPLGFPTYDFASLSVTDVQNVRALPLETSFTPVFPTNMGPAYGLGFPAPTYDSGLPTPVTINTMLPMGEASLPNTSITFAASLPSASRSFSPLEGASPNAPVITPDSDSAHFEQQAVLSRSAPSTVPSFSSLPSTTASEFPFTPMSPSSGFAYEVYSAEPTLSSTPVYNSLLPPVVSTGMSTPDGIELESTPESEWFTATA